MSLFSYLPDFSNRYEISHAISVKFSGHYNGVGKISIILPLDDFNINAIKNNSMIYDTKSKFSFYIENLKIDTVNNQIVANGYTANRILNKRAVIQLNQIKSIEQGAYNLVQSNLRGLPRVRLAPLKNIPDLKEAQVSGGQLADRLIDVLNLGSLGHRMNWDYNLKQHELEIYKGEDRTSGPHAVVFSDEFGTAKNLVISDDITTLKNTYYISGELLNGQKIVEVVGNENEGADRLEKWIREVPKQEADMAETDFRKLLKERAVLSDADYVRRQNFSVEIDSSDLGTRYNIGDLIRCNSFRFGVKFKARITGFNYSLDIKEEKTSLILGEPNLTILKEMQLNG